MNKKYWQNFGELNQTDAFQKTAANEFKENPLPFEELGEGLLESKTHRRDFLKYLGFSTAAAVIASSCQTPVRKAIPYLKKPDDLIPGVANYYASTYVNEGDAVPVLVKQRDGRPIKIEGNELSSITGGGTSARVQASVLDLYDTTRLRHPMKKDGSAFAEVSTFDGIDKLVGDAINGLGGKPIVLLTSSLNSPTTLKAIDDFKTKFPGSKHIQYDAVSYSAMLLANEATYGKRAIPSYQFDNAKVIVSLGADFLGTWLSPIEFAKQYAVNRRIKSEKPEMSRHIHFEGTLSLTGSNADDRIVHKPSQTGAIALALLQKLGGAVTAPSIDDVNSDKIKAGIELAAKTLSANKGAALVVSGSNDVNIQIIVNAINDAIGANGKTIDWSVTNNSRNGIDADITTLVNDMNSGSIGAVFVYGTNPVYTYGKKFADGLAKVPLTVSFNPAMDETTELCSYIIPAPHWLESWGDAEPKSGYISLIQPTIFPLFKTRPFQTSLLKWSGDATEYDLYFKNYWLAKLGSDDAYDKVLQDGVLEPATAPVASGASFNGAKLSDAASKISSTKGGALELVIYQKVSLGTGSQANNPWLQELPDPITKVTWDNYALMGTTLAKNLLGIDVIGNQRQGDGYEVHPEKPTISITANGQTLKLPVLIIPGVHSNVIAVAVGYGRKSADDNNTAQYIGRAANGAGQNAYPFVGFDGTTFSYTTTVKAEITNEFYPLAQTQVHGSSEGRAILYETTLVKYAEDPEKVLEEPNNDRKRLLPFGGKDYAEDATIYDKSNLDRPGIKWGMNIDLNTCTGCAACVVACTAENNVSVVGKIQVQRAHEMHWLRIDRYFTGEDVENPDIIFQPMLCQHCDNAPCENVCPVAATNHSSEGLNQMAYNRCIGTRYCANNCPFKVRRFNWLDFMGADSFPDNQAPLEGIDLDPAVFQMNEDLTRMVLNPDVTVRSRGVMEKCSFCVQRLQENKLIAKKAQDPSLIRNVKTACMQACPTHAISFSNVNDKESDVYKIRNEEQVNRKFYVLEQLHVLPNVSYLAKVRNTERVVENVKNEELTTEKAGA